MTDFSTCTARANETAIDNKKKNKRKSRWFQAHLHVQGTRARQQAQAAQAEGRRPRRVHVSNDPNLYNNHIIQKNMCN